MLSGPAWLQVSDMTMRKHYQEPEGETVAEKKRRKAGPRKTKEPTGRVAASLHIWQMCHYSSYRGKQP